MINDNESECRWFARLGGQPDTRSIPDSWQAAGAVAKQTAGALEALAYHSIFDGVDSAATNFFVIFRKKVAFVRQISGEIFLELVRDDVPHCVATDTTNLLLHFVD